MRSGDLAEPRRPRPAACALPVHVCVAPRGPGEERRPARASDPLGRVCSVRRHIGLLDGLARTTDESVHI